MHKAKLSAMRQWARSLDGDFLLLSEVAEILDVTERALKVLMHTHPELAPTAVGRRGRVLVYLYTPDEVAVLRAWYTAHPYRQHYWTAAEYEDRCRRERRISYWRARARTLVERGDTAGAAIADERHMTLSAGLRAQYAERNTQ